MSEIKESAKTTETSLEIVDALRSQDGASIKKLQELLDYSQSTVHRHLETLRKYGYVVKRRGEYHVGLQFLTVGGYAQRQTIAFPMIKEKVDELASETGERAQFIVEENGERVYLYTEVGQSSVQTGAFIGKRGPIHTSAGGKAILANSDQDRVEEIIEANGLPKTGPNSISSREMLFEELQTIRDRGYAFNRRESVRGVHAVGSAVTHPNGDVIGALSISGPANRMTGDQFEHSFPDKILAAINELELHIEHSILSQ